MRYSDIKFPDIANGTGCRVSLWLCGCHFHCEECQNPELWDFNVGTGYSHIAEDKIDEYLDLPYCAGLSVLGGEPLEPINEKDLERTLRYFKIGHPEKTIWLYTGYKFEDIKDHSALKFVDILVDGQFEKDKNIVDLKFRGSTNQRKIDVQESLKQNKVIELNFEED